MIRISAALGVIAALASPALGQTQQNVRTLKTSAGEVRVETIARGLNHPWGLAFLPNGRMLVTEREGRLRIVAMDGSLSKPISDVPKVYANSQGGLLDIVLDRDYAKTQMVYFCYAEPSGGASRTAVASAKLIDEGQPRLDDVKVIFRQEPATSRGMHYGCRIAQARDNNLFVTLGDHFTQRDQAQKLDNHIGKIVRIKPDGGAPTDNPFVKRSDAKPEIYSYGHRNSQGAQIHPDTGRLWMHEHGPRGGDEINLPEPGKNYGWPVIGYGVDYSGAKIHASTAQNGMEQPLWHWTPSIAPSGMAFYVGQLFPQWKDNLFVGALSGKMLVRLEVEGQRVVREERMLADINERIRDVRVGPDGALFLLTDADDGRILRLSPASPKL